MLFFHEFLPLTLVTSELFTQICKLKFKPPVKDLLRHSVHKQVRVQLRIGDTFCGTECHPTGRAICYSMDRVETNSGF